MQHLINQAKLIQCIRDFFNNAGFLDVLTPPMVQNPGMETHIHPFEIIQAKDQQKTNLFLHTSPEFNMKKILASNEPDLEKIFTISYCFRNEPDSLIHRSQFIMLEWYRKNAHYQQIKTDLKKLVQTSLLTFQKPEVKITERSVSELFQEFLDFEILDFLDSNELKIKIKKDFKEVPLPDCDLHWDDLYFLLFLNLVEPNINNFEALILDEYPAPLRALSTIKPTDSRVCERFEFYFKGVEIANCFNELTDFQEQESRFKIDSEVKKQLYQYSLPWPEEFLSTLKKGYPKSAGIALGVERLLQVLTDESSFFSP